MTGTCEHASAIRPVVPGAEGCEDCLALGAKWVERRVCLTCGYVGCCEDSPHAHALAHYRATGHPLIASLERDQDWGWCYAHNLYLDLPPGTVSKPRSGLSALLGRLLRHRP